MKKITFLLLVSSFAIQAQDTCVDALPVSAGMHTVESISGSGIPSPDCSPGDTVATAAEWYSFTATTNGVVKITSVLDSNSGSDTRLSVYTGSCDNLTCYAFNDDYSLPSMDFRSEVLFRSAAGTTYYFTFDDGWRSDGFDFEITEYPVSCATELPYETTFEDPNFLVACYSTEDGDENGVSWIQQSLDFDGDGIDETFATNGTNTTIPKDDWLFSPKFSFESGVTYTLTYVYNGLDLNTVNMANETLEIVLANEPSSDASTIEQLAIHESITQNGAIENAYADAVSQSITFTPATSGDYHIGFHTTTIENGGFLVLFGYSVELQLSNPDFVSTTSIFPNPTRDVLIIKQTETFELVELYNLLGQKVLAQSNNSAELNLDLSSVSAGTYVLRLTSNGNQKSMKVVKQ